MDSAHVKGVAGWLQLYLVPGQVTELRGLKRGRKPLRFISDDPLLLARQVVAWDQTENPPDGIYFIPNPLKREMLGQDRSADATDVLVRHWLLLDSDPDRPDGTSATEGERYAAQRHAEAIRGWLEGVGMRAEIFSDSANGFHVDYPIDLPNDDASYALLKSVTEGLRKHCATAGTKRLDSTFDAPRIWKVPGTRARKGVATPERSHRYARVIEGVAWSQDNATHNNDCLRELLIRFAFLDKIRGKDLRDTSALTERERILVRARAYISKEDVAISGQKGHNRTFHVACVLVIGFGLSEDEALEAIQFWNMRCMPPWSEGELRHKIRDAAKEPGERGYLLREGDDDGPAETPAGDGEVVEQAAPDPEEIATAADLITFNAVIRWVWPGWIPLGVLTVVASVPGQGKTRFCLDLARRLALGLPWPDGTVQTYPVRSTTLWVPADNQHSELATIPEQFGFPPELLYLNATKSNPFVGTMLDTADERKAFERRIERVKPALVIVDTCLNATDKTSHKPEDAKAFFKPLQELARRQQIGLLCVTHLNAAGTPLGRRIEGQARVVMQLQKPDPDQEHRRRLAVVKSFGLFPPALGVTMGAADNSYDLNPPAFVEAGSESSASSGLRKAVEWLTAWLEHGPKRVSITRTEAQLCDIGPAQLYRAKEHLGVEQFESQGKKWWRFTSEGDDE